MIPDDVREWVTHSLISKGFGNAFDIIPVRMMPWSCVWRCKVDHYIFYLKVITGDFKRELDILPYLFERYKNDVPEVIDLDLDRGFLLLADSGVTVREFLKTEFDLSVIEKIYQTYVSIQRSLQEKRKDLLFNGLPDWTPAALPFLLEKLDEDAALLFNDGLAQDEWIQIYKKIDVFQGICSVLETSPIISSIEHGDFHDNNFLIKDGRIHIADWGDASVGYPLLSAATMISSLTRNHKIDKSDIKYSHLIDITFSPWSDIVDKDDYIRYLKYSHIARHVQFILSFIRIKKSSNLVQTNDYNGYMAEYLRRFLKLLLNPESNEYGIC
jgi:aminoglycoside/choline kinase family phosphotransferase